MKMAILGLGLCGLLSASAIQSEGQETKGYIPPVQKLKSDIMTPEVLWSFGRVSEPVVSPDGLQLLYGVTYFNIPENKSYRDLYVVPVEGGTARQITNTPEKEYGALWRPDGQKIGYISGKSGEEQLWEISPDGSNPRQVTFVKGGITGFKYSPDGNKILFTGNVKLDQSVQDLFPDLPKANARLETGLMYRHWDAWHDYTYSHVFVADYADGTLSGIKDLMDGERFDSPIKPSGGMEQINWSPDGKQIAYSCKKLTGKAYTLSTNSEIYVYDLATGKTENVSKGCMGYDWNPVYSPDGKYLAWESMERDGYESDKTRIMVKDLTTGQRKNYSENFDQNATLMNWSPDSKTIYFISDWHATEEIYKMEITSGKISPVTNGIHDYHNVAVAGKYLVAEKVSMSQPAEIYRVDPVTGKDEPITTVNDNLLSQLTFGKVEKRWVKTTDNKEMLVWVILPPHFDASKKYPTLLYCEGGPQSTVSQFWSFRWNFQMMAANNYIIVAPNRRGLPGFGMKWLEQISKDYGGQNMNDYLSAIDAVSKEPYVDKDHLGCVGASYGGFSVYYLAGHHQKRFKAFIAHDGIFNMEALYSTTDEMWFENWDTGGAYWDRKNLAAQRSYSFSPHKFVQNWDTPILVIHGGQDFRIPYTQGMGAYNSALLKGIPAEFLFLPEENHWVLGAQNGILWQRVFFGWLDKWLKVDKK